MKNKYYILGVLAALCLLGTGYYVWTLYDAHCKQVAEWTEGAKAAFEEALWLEVDKRSEIPIYSSLSGESGITTLKERIPDSVFVTSVLGRKGYRIERHKYDNSLIKEMPKRARLGVLLNKYPLSIDTLSVCWDSILSERQISVGSQIRYVYTNPNLDNDTVFSDVDEELPRLDSLTVKYLGFRCEHELVAFVSYPYWMDSIKPVDWCILVLPWILFILLVVCFPRLESLAEQKLMHEKVIEKEIIVEKEIHVADVAIDKAKIYQLPDGSVFDSFAGTLTKDDLTHTLPPQSALLLRLFLRKENHRLTTMEIEQELWNGQGSADKIHKAIQRLRGELRKISSELVIRNINRDYELK